jgi:hypothetical protein
MTKGISTWRAEEEHSGLSITSISMAHHMSMTAFGLMHTELCVHRVYLAGSSGAVLFCLHGCGYTGLTWALVAAAVKDRCSLSLSC